MISLSKRYITRDGRPARVLCVDKKGQYPVVAVVLCGGNGPETAKEEVVYAYDTKGSYCGAMKEWDGGKYLGTCHVLDLIEAPLVTVRYANVFGDHIDETFYLSSKEADDSSGFSDFKGRLKLTFHGENLYDVVLVPVI